VRERTPFVALVFTDGRFGVIEANQLRRFGRSAFVGFGNPDLVALAESFGADGYRIAAADELLPTLRRALDSERVAVIDCPIDYSENERLMRGL
jgi:acetolactate synthase-1/2/3 large subunit